MSKSKGKIISIFQDSSTARQNTDLEIVLMGVLHARLESYYKYNSHLYVYYSRNKTCFLCPV